MQVAIVKNLWRYPVKSLLGEDCQQFTINSRGVEGDRFYAVTDEQGKFGSGKNTRRFRKMNGLFEFAACYQEGRLMVKCPDQAVTDNLSEINLALSECVGQTVTLQREQDVPHFDAGAIHILTTGSIEWLKAQLPDAVIDQRRFRANIILDTDSVEPVEQNWLGKTIKIGDVTLQITGKTQRCAMTGFKQSELPREPSIVKCIAKQLNSDFGVYAKVIETGMIKQNDVVQLL
ncbi:MAG: hypothetical protein ACI8WB_006221 [Phenylobacterium sp.]|jgi:uncharacterized protein YcbX